MLSEIINILTTGIGAVISWFNQLVTGDLWVLLFSFISMAFVARFLIFPFFGAGSSGSDRSKKNKGDL